MILLGVFKSHLVFLTYLGGCLQRDPLDAVPTFPQKDKRFLALWLYLSQEVWCQFFDISLGNRTGSTLWLYIEFHVCVYLYISLSVCYLVVVCMCIKFKLAVTGFYVKFTEKDYFKRFECNHF